MKPPPNYNALHEVHKIVVGGSSMIGFPLVIAVSVRDMPGIETGLLGWHTSALTNELQEVCISAKIGLILLLMS